jgi:SOS-response transcriptional repressor LexA
MPVTQAQKTEAQTELVRAIAEAIKELGTVPSGHLYARIAGKISSETFERVLATLKGAGLISVSSSHLITWTGGSR